MSSSPKLEGRTPEEFITDGQFVAIKSSKVEEPVTIRVGFSIICVKLYPMNKDLSCFVTLHEDFLAKKSPSKIISLN